jgi:hypothetical protein
MNSKELFQILLLMNKVLLMATHFVFEYKPNIILAKLISKDMSKFDGLKCKEIRIGFQLL